MSTTQMQSEIGKLLHFADDRMLAAIHSMLKGWLDHDPALVGFSTDGQPLTRKELLELVETSRKEGLNGQARQVDELINEVENW